MFKRKDGTSIHRTLSPSRQLMPMFMGPATDCWVLAEEIIKIQPALDFIEQWNQTHSGESKITLNHLLLRSCAKAIELHPRLNRFLAGHRYYQRKGTYIAFSAKKEFSSKGGLLVFKRQFTPEESMDSMIVDMRRMINKDRTVEKSGQEKENKLFSYLPGPVFSLALKGIQKLDDFNLLPYSFIEHMPFYASMFIANLGSLGMNSGWHHLYRFGNVPVFGVMGAPYDAAVVEEGQVVARKVVSLKWTFDERIEDGYNAGRAAQAVTHFLEHPEELI